LRRARCAGTIAASGEENGLDRVLAVESFRFQARGCAAVGSPLYADLLARAADDLEAGGVFAELVEGFEGHPVLLVLPLRVMGAVHRLVLAGRAPALAAHYPSAGGRFEPEGAWRALLDVARDHAPAIRARLGSNVQTNEVRRCAALLGGFLRVARETGLPLRLREIGSSAGLNQLFDRYGYELGPHRWGEPQAPLVLRAEWEGGPPDLGAPLRVASRAGCDVDPIDPRDAEDRLRLESFVWPDQPERLARLRAALAAAQLGAPAPVERARAGEWVPRELAARPAGEATVLVQSHVYWYLPEAEREGLLRDVRAAGERASAERPIAWLRLEGATADQADVRLWLWPPGVDHLLARCHNHGAWVRWLS
jgi:hypothetical protein